MTVYLTDWYKLDVELQRMLLLIMIRSQKSVIVKAPFFSPSLPGLRTVSFFNFLRNINIFSLRF